jgi:hypothetical protein
MHENDSTSVPTRTLKRRRGQRLTQEERAIAQKKFLDSFKLNANITVACAQANIDRSQIYRWQELDEDFSFAYKQAELAANDMLLAAAWKRGVQGYEKPVVSMGKQVYVDGKPLMERVYSDTVLLRLMSARMPEFRDKQQLDINTTNTGTRDPLLQALSDEQLDAIEQIIHAGH